MEALLSNTDQLKGKLKEKIENHKEQGVLSKKLATILLDAPIELNEDDLQTQKFDAEKVKTIFEELEFRTLAKRILNSKEEQTEKVEGKQAQAKRAAIGSNGSVFNDGRRSSDCILSNP